MPNLVYGLETKNDFFICEGMMKKSNKKIGNRGSQVGTWPTKPRIFSIGPPSQMAFAGHACFVHRKFVFLFGWILSHQGASAGWEWLWDTREGFGADTRRLSSHVGNFWVTVLGCYAFFNI
jgi:hypothetical protein